jgi:choline dehydrogenase-like flavoprotein
MSDTFDVIVVGSGPGGVNAAAPLVAAGKRVLMLDYGNEDRAYAPLIPHEPFSTLRRTDGQQHRYLIGDRFEGVPFGGVRVGAQLTPPRAHIMRDSPELQPADAEAFAVGMSLARGGLGAGWSAGVFPFTDDELADMGLGVAAMQPHYDAVVERIGVCGPGEDLERFFPTSPAIMPSLDVDVNAETILARYERKRADLNAAGLRAARASPCARGSTAAAGRTATSTSSTGRHGPQRLSSPVDARRAPAGARLHVPEPLPVQTFREDADGVRVDAVHADDGRSETHAARTLVLAGGTSGRPASCSARSTATRPASRWSGNAYAYVPMLNFGMLRARPARSALAAWPS